MREPLQQFTCPSLHQFKSARLHVKYIKCTGMSCKSRSLQRLLHAVRQRCAGHMRWRMSLPAPYMPAGNSQMGSGSLLCCLLQRPNDRATPLQLHMLGSGAVLCCSMT